MQTDVLVVGAGPTGLMLGTELGLAGMTPVVIDALPVPSGQAKGGVVQPRTAEVFDLRGMMDQLLEGALLREPIGGHFGGTTGWSRPQPQPRRPGRVQPRLETRRRDSGSRPSRTTRQLSHRTPPGGRPRPAPRPGPARAR